MSQTFPRNSRLLTVGDFRRVFEAPLKSSDAVITVLGRPRTDRTTISRLGLAIARKQLKRAVDRNRVKRISREVFRQLPGMQHPPALDYVVMVRTRVLQLSNNELANALQQHFKRLISQVERA